LPGAWQEVAEKIRRILGVVPGILDPSDFCLEGLGCRMLGRMWREKSDGSHLGKKKNTTAPEIRPRSVLDESNRFESVSVQLPLPETQANTGIQHRVS
jgi:hypothetical protein